MSNKMFYQQLFVVLVYKNTEVLTGFFQSINAIPSHHVIIVNSFYDETSERECERMATIYHADFISVPNKGYSYGNNRGVEYANEHYDYKFLIVSNSDIIVQDISYLDDINEEKLIIAPNTRMLNGKRQNPNIVYDSWLYSLFMKWGYTYCSIFVTCAHIVSRASREMFLLMVKLLGIRRVKVFSPHGSFIIFTRGAVQEMLPIFNDQMFLYNEEWHVAYKAKFCKIPVHYIPKLHVLHLEGASSSSNTKMLNQYYRDSYFVLMEYLRKQKQNQ